ncbi:MAG: D-2-hydroxyacid dehydrogenase [Verrucomicrobiia bacterium]
MKIVVLDGYTMNPGDLSWDSLSALGNCIIYDRTPCDLVIERARDAEILLTNKVVIDRGVIEALPNLRYIGVLATGYNVVDITAAKQRGIIVTNVPDYSTMSVAQLTFSLLFELTNHVALHDQSVKSGEWTKSPDFCYWKTPLIELDGLTFGIIGFGKIGRTVAKIAQSFGMKVTAFSPSLKNSRQPDITFSEINDIFASSDVVSLHCPLTPQTEKIVNRKTLNLMKPTAFLINTGRGGLVDEQALADALNSGVIAGAAVDVLSTEPPSADNPLLTANNIIITPHIGWATKAARIRLMEIVVDNIKAFLSGNPKNMVNG